MNQSRRSFLGTVIGTLVATQLPFVTKAAQFKESEKRNINSSQYGKYKGAILCNGEWIELPPLSYIEKIGADRIDFVFLGFNPIVPLTLTKVRLMDESGVVVTERAHSSIYMMVGDTLNLTCTCTLLG